MIIRDKELEYIEETHTYIYDGVVLPSVTQVLKVKFGDMYNRVNEDVLNRAATRGTQIHSDIEAYVKGEERNTEEVRGFKFLQVHYDIVPYTAEVPVVVFKGGLPKCAGRLDLLADVGGKYSIADIKTTATLNKEYLAYQLNLYRVGFEQSYGVDIEKLVGLHLIRAKRKLVEIPINDICVKEILEEYERGLDE